VDRPLHLRPLHVLLHMQVASKLQLVSAFVAAHSTAQEVFSAHFAEPGPPSHTGGQDAAAAASSTSTQDPSTAADASTANSAASGRHNSKAHNSSSSKYADTSSSGDQPSTGVEGKGFPPKSGADDDTDMQLAHRVVQESRAEADAALQYAHNVSSSCVKPLSLRVCDEAALRHCCAHMRYVLLRVAHSQQCAQHSATRKHHRFLHHLKVCVVVCAGADADAPRSWSPADVAPRGDPSAGAPEGFPKRH
jgi:hypothetical protein